jgi:hypothetical protein
MTDAVDETEFDEAVGKEPESPALLARGRCATGERNQVRFHLPGDLQGHARWQGLIVERRWPAPGEKAAADIPHRVPMAAQGLGHCVITEGGGLILVQKQ